MQIAQPNRILFALLCAALSGCGGGGAGDSLFGGGATTNTTAGFFGVTGVRNGSSFTACIDNIEQVDPGTDRGKAISSKVAAYYGLSGTINSVSGAGQTCRAKYPLADAIVSADFYNSNILSYTPPPAPAPTPTPTPSPTPTPTPSPVLYTTWTGSANGVVILDADNNQFAVRLDDRNVVYQPNGSAVRLNGLIVDSSANVISGGAAVGRVTTALSTSGSQIAVMKCSSGTTMRIVVSGSYTIDCGGTGGTGGSPTPAPTPAPTTRPFITWTGSTNGSTVVDAGNERFAFYADTRCLYSYNRNAETNNFCLGPGASGNFAGQAIQVLKIASTSGGCIAALADPGGYQVDIFTSSTGVQTVSTRTSKWDTRGCTG